MKNRKRWVRNATFEIPSRDDDKVRVMNVLHFSEEEILLAFQTKMAELRSRREDGLQDLHEAYQVK